VTDRARSYAGQTAEERAAGRRARLVRAAITVLGEQGESRTTMTAICAEAGLTERYFYESFAGRDEALLAALDAVSGEIAATAVAAIEAASGPATERVRAAIGAVVALVVREPAKARVAVVESAANPRLRARRHELVGVFADLVAREAAELFGAEAWPTDRARVHGVVFVAGLAELVATWLAGELDLTPEEVTDAGSDLFTAVTRR
jgi:AcrR family transcriptional regulator